VQCNKKIGLNSRLADSAAKSDREEAPLLGGKA